MATAADVPNGVPDHAPIRFVDGQACDHLGSAAPPPVTPPRHVWRRASGCGVCFALHANTLWGPGGDGPLGSMQRRQRRRRTKPAPWRLGRDAGPLPRRVAPRPPGGLGCVSCCKSLRDYLKQSMMTAVIRLAVRGCVTLPCLAGRHCRIASTQPVPHRSGRVCSRPARMRRLCSRRGRSDARLVLAHCSRRDLHVGSGVWGFAEEVAAGTRQGGAGTINQHRRQLSGVHRDPSF